MYKVTADSIDDYLNFDPARRADLLALDQVISARAANLERHFHPGTPPGEPGMRFKMIGYGRFHYPAAQGKSVAWPVIGVALQKNYISVYLSATKAGRALLGGYVGDLRPLRSGGNNFSFRCFDDLDRPTFERLVAEAGEIFANDPANPVRYWTGSR